MKISEIQRLDTSGTSPTFGTLVQMTLLQTSLNLQLSVQLRDAFRKVNNTQHTWSIYTDKLSSFQACFTPTASQYFLSDCAAVETF